MLCPRCGREVQRDAEACRGCGYVVGMRSLLPDENTERHARFGGDAVIVGKLGTRFESFLSDRTDAFFPSRGAPRTASDKAASSSAPSQVYVDAELKALLRPETVLERIPQARDDGRWSDVERRVLAEIDGVQPVAFVLTRSGVTTDELCLAIALLVDKGAVRAKTMASPDRTGPLPKFSSSVGSDTERNPVWSPSRTMPEPPSDLSILHDLVVQKLRATGLPVPGEGHPKTGVHDTLPGVAEDRTDPVGEPATDAGSGADEVRRLWLTAAQREGTGDFAGAVQAMRDATMVRPDDAVLLNRLGVLLATRTMDYAGARAALERAVELEPRNAFYKNNLKRVVAADKRRK